MGRLWFDVIHYHIPEGGKEAEACQGREVTEWPCLQTGLHSTFYTFLHILHILHFFAQCPTLYVATAESPLLLPELAAQQSTLTHLFSLWFSEYSLYWVALNSVFWMFLKSNRPALLEDQKSSEHPWGADQLNKRCKCTTEHYAAVKKNQQLNRQAVVYGKKQVAEYYFLMILLCKFLQLLLQTPPLPT